MTRNMIVRSTTLQPPPSFTGGTANVNFIPPPPSCPPPCVSPRGGRVPAPPPPIPPSPPLSYASLRLRGPGSHRRTWRTSTSTPSPTSCCGPRPSAPSGGGPQSEGMPVDRSDPNVSSKPFPASCTPSRPFDTVIKSVDLEIRDAVCIPLEKGDVIKSLKL